MVCALISMVQIQYIYNNFYIAGNYIYSLKIKYTHKIKIIEIYIPITLVIIHKIHIL